MARANQMDAQFDESAKSVPPEKDAYTVEEFCVRNSVSKSVLYEMWREGTGPRFMKRGKWVRISREAAAAWRATMEGGNPAEDAHQSA